MANVFNPTIERPCSDGYKVTFTSYANAASVFRVTDSSGSFYGTTNHIYYWDMSAATFINLTVLMQTNNPPFTIINEICFRATHNGQSHWILCTPFP